MFETFLKSLSARYVNSSVEYSWSLAGQDVDLSRCIGSTIVISFLNKKKCIHCSRLVKTLYQGGYCYPCTLQLASCDVCMVRPELCHFDDGTCRDVLFAQQQCFQPHYLYLAKSDVIKVGITRKSRFLQRWMEQGVVEASILAQFPSRKQVGDAEKFLKSFFKDRANWRRMLKNEISEEDLVLNLAKAKEVMPVLMQSFCVSSYDVLNFSYPVRVYPQKISSLKLDKTPVIRDVLQGIKGQYLLFESSVFNVRSHQGYLCSVEYSSC